MKKEKDYLKHMNLLRPTKGCKDEVLVSDRNGGLLSLVDFTPDFYDDKVVLNEDVFQDLYGVPRFKASKGLKLLAIIKITNKNCESIHRAFLGKKGVSELDMDRVGLSTNSIRLLNGDGENPDYIDEVTISKGCWFNYFGDHLYI